MANGFSATKDKSTSQQADLIKTLRGKTTVTNKELSELIIALIEKLEK